jgi:dynein heavy chain 2
VSAAPPLTLMWLPKGAPQPHPQSIAVPLYSSLERQKVVAELQLPLAGPGSDDEDMGQQRQYWVLAGVALMLPA